MVDELEPDPEKTDQIGRIASFDNAIKCELCDIWSSSPLQFNTHKKRKMHVRKVCPLRWKTLIEKLRIETKTKHLLQDVTDAMTECLNIDPWRKMIKKQRWKCLLLDRWKRVITACLSLAETENLLLQWKQFDRVSSNP